MIEIECPKCHIMIPKLHNVYYCPICDVEWEFLDTDSITRENFEIRK